ncbi:MAG: haloacid dehalogenase [Microbacteriaceae bacterium]|jgi:phosphoglycolate phosphatase|nr:haloacid dehalogenase [Microbacteriaceae bacterium]
MNTDWTCILFDLDGTITHSAPGITASLGLMFEELGKPVPSAAELLEYVGPPILDSFRDLAGMTHEESAQALAIYRRHYLENGTSNSSVYPGIPEVLRAIHKSPLLLSLATSKPEFPAAVMLDNANLTQYFDVITGASADEVRSAKADVIAEALVRLKALGADVSRPVMVGDRKHDVEGAAANGVPTIFVEWGYGSPAEHVGTIEVVQAPEQLVPLLLGR